MKGNELVWRTLADRALDGERYWSNVADLAFRAGVPATTAYLALDRLDEIGGVTKYPRGGLSVVSLEKVVSMLCSRRSIRADTIRTTVFGAIPEASRVLGFAFALGGPEAARKHLGDNHVADFAHGIAYVEQGADLSDLPEGDEVAVLTMDRRARLDWDGYSSIAQTYADLFATPGWAATEYRYALRDRFFDAREWEERDEQRRP